MKRVMIVGGAGSGKSTLARWMGTQTGGPVQHIDHIHWQSGWVARPSHEKIALLLAVEVQGRWIIEGGMSATHASRSVPVARSQTVLAVSRGNPT